MSTHSIMAIEEDLTLVEARLAHMEAVRPVPVPDAAINAARKVSLPHPSSRAHLRAS